MFWNRVDRYISGLFWTYFLGGLVVFVTLFMAVDSMSMLANYDNPSTDALIRYYGYAAPEVIYRMIPVACLLGTLFALSHLNRSNELVALYSIGFGIKRVSASIVFWVLILCGFCFYLSDRVIPNFTKQKNFIFYHEIKKKPSMFSIVKNERIWYRSHDKIFNIKTLNESTHQAYGLTLYYFTEEWDLLQMITAQVVNLGKETWTLENGSVTIFSGESSFPQTSEFKKKTIPMEKDTEDLSSTGNTSDMLTISELKQFIKKNKAAGLDTTRYEVDYYAKFGYALAGLVMSLLGIPFAVVRSRSGGVMANLGICLGLVFLYWIFYSSALTLGNFGQIPPILAAWAPNGITAAIALWILRLKRS